MLGQKVVEVSLDLVLGVGLPSTPQPGPLHQEEEDLPPLQGPQEGLRMAVPASVAAQVPGVDHQALRGIHREGAGPGDGVVHGEGLHPEGTQGEGDGGLLPGVALQEFALGRALLGEGLEFPVEKVEGAAPVGPALGLQDPLIRLQGAGVEVGGLPVHPHLAHVLHGLGDGGGSGGGHHGEVLAQVAQGPGVVQVGVAEEEGQDPLPVHPHALLLRPLAQEVLLQGGGEEGVPVPLAVEARHRGQEAQEEEVPKAQAVPGPQELGEVGSKAAKGLAEVQEEASPGGGEEDLVPPDLPPASPDENLQASKGKALHKGFSLGIFSRMV